MAKVMTSNVVEFNQSVLLLYLYHMEFTKNISLLRKALSFVKLKLK